MKNDLRNILSNLNKDIEQEKLLQYLNKEMSDPERHEFEKLLSEDEFGEDALEGLEALTDKQQLSHVVEQLNLGLKNKIRQNRSKRLKKIGQPDQFVYIAIILVLIIAVAAYLILRRM